MNKKVVIAALALATLIGGVGFWKNAANTPAAPGKGAHGGPVAVETVIALPSPAIFDLRAVGTLVSSESVDITPEYSGRIAQIGFIEGQHVKKGDTLVKIDDSTAKAELAQAQAVLALARQNHARAQSLQRSGAVSQASRDETSSRLQEAEATHALAKVKLEKTSLDAPFDGIIGLRSVSEGDYVEAGKAITHLEMVDPIKVEFSMPETAFASLKPGQAVTVTVDAYPGKRFEGSVYAIDPRIDETTRSVRVKASIPNPERDLRPGMFAYASLTLSRQDAILIPEEAILPQGKESFVYRVKEGVAALIPVRTGQRREGKVEITGGINPNDEIVVAGQMKLREGAKVESTRRGEGSSPLSP